MTVHFESKKRLADRWRLFFHLDGPGGFRNLDHVPVDGLLPVERWRPGQRIRDAQRIFIPPARRPAHTPSRSARSAARAPQGHAGQADRRQGPPARRDLRREVAERGREHWTCAARRERCTFASPCATRAVHGPAGMLVCAARGTSLRRCPRRPLGPRRTRARLGCTAVGRRRGAGADRDAVALIAPLRAPKDADWAAAERGRARRVSQPGDLIVAAPAWADPIMRMHLGDLIPLATAGAHGRRALRRASGRSTSAARTRPRRARGASSLERRHGALTVRRVERTGAAVSYDFLARWNDAHVSRVDAQRRRPVPCPLQGDRFQCPQIGFNYVKRQTGRGRHDAPRRRCWRSRSTARASSSSSPPCALGPRAGGRDRPAQCLDAQGGQGHGRSDGRRSTAQPALRVTTSNRSGWRSRTSTPPRAPGRPPPCASSHVARRLRARTLPSPPRRAADR